MTGFDEGALPASLQGLPLCVKPFNVWALVGALQRLLGDSIATTRKAASS